MRPEYKLLGLIRKIETVKLFMNVTWPSPSIRFNDIKGGGYSVIPEQNEFMRTLHFSTFDFPHRLIYGLITFLEINGANYLLVLESLCWVHC